MTQQMKIKIIAVETGNAKTKKGQDYKFLEVTFKNLSFQDKVDNKKVMPFGSKEVFATLENANNGDVFTVLREKDNDGYWQWVGIAAGDVVIETTGASAAQPKAAEQAKPQAAKSTFETPEERAIKQVYIIKQSSLGYAITTLKTDKKNPTKEEVVQLADYYTKYVFGKLDDIAVNNITAPDVDEPSNDIPY